jgi:hypothetical protein
MIALGIPLEQQALHNGRWEALISLPGRGQGAGLRLQWREGFAHDSRRGGYNRRTAYVVK